MGGDRNLSLLAANQLFSFSHSASVSLADPSQPATSSNNLLAYRPNYQNNGMGVVFLNLDGIFPCASVSHPLCGLVTVDEDGFFGSFVQASDAENNHIFSSDPTTLVSIYALALEGCPQLNSQCWPNLGDVAVMCQLPRHLCG